MVLAAGCQIYLLQLVLEAGLGLLLVLEPVCLLNDLAAAGLAQKLVAFEAVSFLPETEMRKRVLRNLLRSVQVWLRFSLVF